MESGEPIPTLVEKIPHPIQPEYDEKGVLAQLLPLDHEKIDNQRVALSEYFQHDQKTPDVIVVLAGGVTTNPDGSQESPLYTNGTDNKNLVTGAKYRVIAAAIGASLFPEASIQTNSISKELRLRPVDVMAEELISLEVNPDNIIKEEQGKESESTFGNIARLIEMIGQHETWGTIDILTNGYHIPRVTKIAELVIEEAIAYSKRGNESSAKLRYLREPELSADFYKGLERIVEGQANLQFISCEAVVGAYAPEFKQSFEDLSNTYEYAKRVVSERQGIYQLIVGSYGRTI